MLSITLEYLEKRLIVHLMTTVGGAGAQCIGCIQLIGQYINTFITQILKNLSAVKVHVSTVVGLFIINPETVFAQFVTPRLAKNYIIPVASWQEGVFFVPKKHTLHQRG